MKRLTQSMNAAVLDWQVRCAVLGWAATWFVLGAGAQLRDNIAPGYSGTWIIVLACCLAILLGIILPNQYARLFVKISQSVLSRYAGQVSHQFARGESVARDAFACEKELHLRAISSISLVLGGLGMMTCGLLLKPLEQLFEHLLNRFYWTWIALYGLELGLAFFYVLIPMSLVGISINCIQRGMFLRQMPSTSLLVGLLLGIVLGLACSIRVPIGASFWILNTPPLMLLALGVYQGRLKPGSFRAPSFDSELPELSSPWRGWLTWMACMVGVLIVLQMGAWQRFMMPNHGIWMSVLALSALLLGVAYPFNGALVGERRLRRIAIVCICSALSIAGALILGWRLWSADASTIFVFTVIGVVPFILAGVVLACVMSTVARQGGHRSNHLLRVLLSGGVGVCLASVWNVFETIKPSFPFYVLSFAALIWLLLGGLTLIYEPRFEIVTSRCRVAFLLASMLAIFWLLPVHVRPWQQIWKDATDTNRFGLALISSHDKLERWMRKLHVVPGAHLQKETPINQLGPFTADGVLAQLRYRPRRWAGILIEWGGSSSMNEDDSLGRGVARTLKNRLAPGGSIFSVHSADSVEELERDSRYQQLTKRLGQPRTMRRVAEGDARELPQWICLFTSTVTQVHTQHAGQVPPMM